MGPLPNGPFMIFYGLYMGVSKHLAMHLVSFIVLFVYVFLWENAASDDKWWGRDGDIELLTFCFGSYMFLEVP